MGANPSLSEALGIQSKLFLWLSLALRACLAAAGPWSSQATIIHLCMGTV